MGLDQARGHEPAAGVDDAGGGTCQRANLGIAADGAEQPVLDRHGFGSRPRRVGGEDVGIDDDQRWRGEGGVAEQGQGKEGVSA